VIVTLENNYRLGLTKSYFDNLIDFNKVLLQNEVSIESKTPNISEDTDVLNIHCGLIRNQEKKQGVSCSIPSTEEVFQVFVSMSPDITQFT